MTRQEEDQAKREVADAIMGRATDGRLCCAALMTAAQSCALSILRGIIEMPTARDERPWNSGVVTVNAVGMLTTKLACMLQGEFPDDPESRFKYAMGFLDNAGQNAEEFLREAIETVSVALCGKITTTIKMVCDAVGAPEGLDVDLFEVVEIGGPGNLAITAGEVRRRGQVQRGNQTIH